MGGEFDDKTLVEKLKHGKMSAKELMMFSMGTAVATVLPTPGDIAHFYFLRWINDNRYKLSPTRYWAYNAVDYYFVDAAYWWALFGWVLLSKRPVEEKTKIYTGVLAAGAVVGILGKFVTDEQKHREELAQETGGNKSEKAMDQADYVNETQQTAQQSSSSSSIQKSAPSGAVRDFELIL